MHSILATTFESFVRNPAASRDVIQSLITAINIELPPDYIEAFQFMNGGEGFVGESYFRLYPAEKIIPLNTLYGTSEFAPNLLIFGSNGGGEAFAFDKRRTPIRITQIPFIPMRLEYAIDRGESLSECIAHLKANSKPNPPASQLNPSLIGKEIHEILPVVFGGDTIDQANKVFLTPEEYAPYVVWWNRKYQQLKSD